MRAKIKFSEQTLIRDQTYYYTAAVHFGLQLKKLEQI